MINRNLLDIVMWIELGLLVLAVVVFFAHGVWLFASQKRFLRDMTAARDSLARVLTRGTVNVEEIEVLRRIPRDAQAAAFLEASRNVTGAGKERLRFVAREIALLDRARKLCENRRWTRRLRGARILARMDVTDPIVEKLLGDSNPAVRAQAAEWAASHPSPGVISIMLTMLADPATQARFAVQDALLRMGSEVVEPLEAFLETHTGSPAESGLRVAEALAETKFLPAALRHSASDEVGVQTAAANLLGAIGGAAAAARLTELLKDPDSLVRAAAAHGLGRMQHWPAAAQLAECLRDPTWRVRRDAGLALRAIGAPGALFLRRALKGNDPFAADMSQQVLDLPAAAAG
ncbi:MAG TPA: HEAT repeat domain-containing protein [Gemmatimonadaceae bacterium]|nr:HEAT repeat domain-containing protein [Gemmatimonadaceae bacterium]